MPAACCRGDYPTHGAHEGRPYKGLSRAWWEPNVGQAHALQVWPRSVDVTRTSYSRTNRPCRVVPAHQGMKIGCIGWWKGQVSPGPRTPPLAGDKPQRYISLATLGCRCSGDGSWCRRPAPELIPDRSPGHAFVPIAHAGWRRHTKVVKIGCIGWWKGQVSPGPRTPPLAGDKPQRYISLATAGLSLFGNDGSWCRRPVPELIPDRSPGHAFVPMSLT